MSQRSERLGECPALKDGRPCKKRACRVCGVRWARDWRKSMEENLRGLCRPVVLISITAPGAELLVPISGGNPLTVIDDRLLAFDRISLALGSHESFEEGV